MANGFDTQHLRWLACTRRNPAAHSAFLYGVRSTKIYCRPTCTARLARRANVVFYDTYEAAQRDGFRPCKRCKPDDVAFRGDAEELVTRVLALLCMKASDPSFLKGGLKELASSAGVTPSYLCRVFKKTMGMTIGTYIKTFEDESIRSDSPASLSDTMSPNQMIPFTTIPQHDFYLDAEQPVCQVVSPPPPLDLDQDFDTWLATIEFSRNGQYSWLWKDDLESGASPQRIVF